MRRLLYELPILMLVIASAAKPTEINELPESTARQSPLWFPDTDNRRVNTTKVVSSSQSSEHFYNSVIEALEKINVLPHSCIKFDKITREVLHVDETASVRTIGVYLYFQESSQWGDNLDDSVKSSRELSPNSNLDNSLKEQSGSQHKVRCHSESKVVMMDAHSLLRQQDVANASRSASGSEYNNTVTSVIVGAHSNSDSENTEGAITGISRTQLVVISTCSAIIGTFFLIAGILRVRNYYKRYRQQQRQASRPTFRSCSVALRNSTPSNEQIHRDSLLSKSSSVQSNFTGRGTGTQYPASQSSRDNSRNNSPKAYADKTPLLVVTSPSDTTNASTPTVSQASLQCPEDDPSRRKNAKPPITNEDDKENSPLLVNSDDNHIDIGQISDEGYIETILNNKGPLDKQTPMVNGDSENVKDFSVKDSCPKVKEVNNVPITEIEKTRDGLVNNAPKSSTADGQTRPVQSPELSPGTNEATMLIPLDSTTNENAGFEASNFGLTQSDSSLSSTNPAYAYGNQTEYSNGLSHFEEIMIHGQVFNDTPSHRNPRLNPLPMPSLRSFSENSFDYGSGTNTGRIAASTGAQAGSSRGDHSMMRSMSLVDSSPKGRRDRRLMKTNSVVGEVASDLPVLGQISDPKPSEQSENCVSPAQQNMSAQAKRELFGCGQDTNIQSSGELSRETSTEVTPPTITKLLTSCEEEKTTFL
ncbi:uncharacterized protein LOC124116921 isoform X1 [Haliotis rufescens]|uniref:uncharacterized protein LOC124116921 isoform X1 n=1 Tax=Haliotis rufescens TaxID=6454 RepID=UPI001EB02A59|nr:uncharacterized protein LOC124116921 isoform X1 [Haliotis rufescens]XP_046334517.1 uncharacterized protein LOC124116921 isoform X1 [Haliotis rufescens]XP_048250046.1 uncharacterized protein LOC124116921 isoform X1 [Haliotis rufescens]XP_048250047.1 uncharacterized protein LOC124116921 isoform X1 [Haliotis rufescens]